VVGRQVGGRWGQEVCGPGCEVQKCRQCEPRQAGRHSYPTEEAGRKGSRWHAGRQVTSAKGGPGRQVGRRRWSQNQGPQVFCVSGRQCGSVCAGVRQVGGQWSRHVGPCRFQKVCAVCLRHALPGLGSLGMRRTGPGRPFSAACSTFRLNRGISFLLSPCSPTAQLCFRNCR